MRNPAQKIIPRLGWPLLIILTLIPVIMWIMMVPLDQRFESPYMAYASIGRVTGIIALALFCINIVLSTRLRVIEAMFDGLNKSYFAHHLTGGIALCIVLMHPIALALRSWTVSLHDAAVLQVPFVTDLGTTFGILALWLFIFLMLVTLYIRLPYQLWLFSHKFMGLVLLGMALHVLLTESELSITPVLSWYSWGLFSIAGIAFLYRTIFPRIFIRKQSYTVVKVYYAPNTGMARFILMPVKRPIRFQPGQFIFLSFAVKGISSEAHPFSISSSSESEPLAITVKGLGEYTKRLLELNQQLVGTKVLVEGAYGHFTFTRFMRRRQIWIAGGVGVTPFLSMIPNVPKGYQIDFYYSVKNLNEIIDWGLLDNVAKRSGGDIRIVPYVTDKYGHLSADEVARISGDISNAEILICGPNIMMHSLQEQFQKIGIKKKYIHSEEFAML